MTEQIDLNRLDGPVLVFGGPYGNLQATQAMRRYAEAHRIPPGRVVCTGDLVAYCADPVATVDEIRDWGCHVVMGNCEESLAGSAPDCGCGFDADSACAVMSDQWYRYADGQVSNEQRSWMAGLPRRILFDLAGRRCAVVHGAASSINRFVFASEADERLLPEFARAGTDVIVAGHSGIPFTRRIGRYVWHNAGVIGMPANDGRPEVWFSLLSEQAGAHVARPPVRGPSMLVRHQRLAYDVGRAYRRMQQAGLDNGYAQALRTGIWPSMDLLPEVERMRAGRPIADLDELQPVRV